MFTRVVLALCLLIGAQAFAPANFGARVQRSMALNADLLSTAANLQGPHICWGSEGVELGHEENDIKGYDNFGSFVRAAEAAGLGDVLRSGGPYTIFAPVDSALEGVNLTPDQVKYHIVEGKIPYGSISGSMRTLNGQSLTYRRQFRQTYVDDAIVGLEDNFGGGSKYPVDVNADNGVIHSIDSVLTPGWSKVDAESGVGGIAN